MSISLPCFWIGPYVSCLSPSCFFELHLPYFDPVLLILFGVEPSVLLLSRSISFNWDYFYSIVTQSFQFIQPVLPFFDSEFIQSFSGFFFFVFCLFCFVFFIRTWSSHLLSQSFPFLSRTSAFDSDFPGFFESGTLYFDSLFCHLFSQLFPFMSQSVQIFVSPSHFFSQSIPIFNDTHREKMTQFFLSNFFSI